MTQQPCVNDLGYLYRIDDRLYAPPVDEYETPIGNSKVDLMLVRFQICKRTRCGVWVIEGTRRKFVNLTAKKQFACVTLGDAIASFRARKQRQISIHAARVRVAKEALAMLDRKVFDEDRAPVMGAFR